MRIIYRKPIWEKIVEARYDAQKTGRVIDRIFLTKSEIRELKDHCSSWWALPIENPKSECRFMGIDIFSEDLTT